MIAPRSAWRLLAYAMMWAALLWPALYNGQPIFYQDTPAYIRGADAGIQAVFRRKSPWSLSEDDALEKPPQADGGPVRAGEIQDKTPFAGRSPFYGAWLYLGELTGGFWLSIGLQALAILVSLTLLLRAVQLPEWPHLPLLAALLALGTSAPFFASFLMPDFLAGVAILGCAVLLGVGDELDRRDRAAWVLLLFAAAITHDSHALIIGASLLLALALDLLRASWENRRGMAALLGVLLAAALTQAALGAAVRRTLGTPLLRPPFLTAHLIAEGIGYRYLKDSCPGSGFKVCEFLDRLPMPASQFLWRTGPEDTGVFKASGPETRRALSAEQYRFALAVFRSDPWGGIVLMLRSTASQLLWQTEPDPRVFNDEDMLLDPTRLVLTDFRYDDNTRALFELTIPAEHLGAMKRSAAYRGTMPTGPCSLLILGVFASSAAFLVFVLARRAAPPAGAVAGWIAAGVVLNSAIFAVLSPGPRPRFAVRVEWLVPLAALLVAAAIRGPRAGDKA